MGFHHCKIQNLERNLNAIRIKSLGWQGILEQGGYSNSLYSPLIIFFPIITKYYLTENDYSVLRSVVKVFTQEKIPNQRCKASVPTTPCCLKLAYYNVSDLSQEPIASYMPLSY